MTSMQASRSNGAGRASMGTQEAKAPDYANAIKEIIDDLREGKALTGAQTGVLREEPSAITRLLKTLHPPIDSSSDRDDEAENNRRCRAAISEAILLLSLCSVLPPQQKSAAIPLIISIHRACDKLGEMQRTQEASSLSAALCKLDLQAIKQNVQQTRSPLALSLEDQVALVSLAGIRETRQEFMIGLKKFPDVTEWAQALLKHVVLDPEARLEAVKIATSELLRMVELRLCNQTPQAREIQSVLGGFHDALYSSDPVQVWSPQTMDELYLIGVASGKIPVPDTYVMRGRRDVPPL